MKRRRSALVLGLGVLALLTNFGTAGAHSQLLSSDPSAGSVLPTAPTQVVLTFNETLLEETVAVAISNSTGEVTSDIAASVARATVTIPWAAELAPGTYTVSYRCVSADGHPITGSIDFAYAVASASPPTAPAAAPATQTPPPNFPVGVVGLILALAATITVIFLARRGRK